ncbi:ATP-binding protein [Shinella sp. CPCC 101442]|uniref:sensor histidine kinase n=1 Tax=Shinella sp. CPCC 101442 TaxID=2932265 RepID=UPI00215240DD|nr:ATP-binding protein [Shinella sp. CPCC 101442]MCR6500066.1 ATP-binding protein [Shinella sp. CPCC 101442]
MMTSPIPEPVSPSMHRRLTFLRSPAALAGGWLLLVVLFGLYSVTSHRQVLDQEVSESGRTLQRIISQRVAQHDAHLTSLSALGLARAQPSEDFGPVAGSILRFYPRIVAIDLVSVRAAEEAGVVSSATSADGTTSDPMQVFKAVEKLTPGKAVYGPDAKPGHYRLMKRMDDTLAVSLDIDGTKLVEGEELPRWALLTLSTAEGPLLEEGATSSGETSLLARTISFDVPIVSATQPLRLSLQRQVTLAQLLPPLPFVSFAAVSLLGLVLVRSLLRHRQDAAIAREAAEAASRREALRQHETKLAHALRINSMGEMASGIAHELTQPLTALLSQSQAGRRIAAANGLADTPIDTVLAANVLQAKRAADILVRLRAYVGKSALEAGIHDLCRHVADIVALSRIDLDRRGITLDIDLPDAPALARIDPVEIEQVIHNLVRNAADAVEQRERADGRVVVSLKDAGANYHITVTDNGTGIAPDILPRLFEPFFSSKADGMGLGLSLCESIVERFDGSISAENIAGGGAVFTVRLPAAPETAKREEAAE